MPQASTALRSEGCRELGFSRNLESWLSWGGGGGPRLPQALGRAGGPVHRVLGRLPDPMAWQEGR